MPETISYLSTLVALRPGDLIMTGTPKGVGRVEPGDRLEGHIDGVGDLTVSYDARVSVPSCRSGVRDSDEFLGVGHRMAAQAAVGQDLVGAHPPQRRRVCVERHRGLARVVRDAVDVGSREREVLAGRGDPGAWRAAERQALPRIRPATTATAPADKSWSWKPVSCSSLQQISQTETCSSRTSCS